MNYSQRIFAVRMVMRKEKADAFLLINQEYSGQPGTRYVCGFSGSTSVLLVTEKKQFLIIDGRYKTQAKKESSNVQVIEHHKESALEMLQQICWKEWVERVLIDSAHTTHGAVVRLKKLLWGLVLIPKESFLQELRICKSEEEIIYIQEAVNIAIAAFTDLLPLITEKTTEQWIAAKLEFLMKERGADRIAFETIVVSGARGALPHGQPSEKKIQKGNLITIDFGAYYKGYASDITRTVAFGKPEKKLKEIYEVVQEAQRIGCAFAHAGISGEKIDTACRDYINQCGYGKYFLHTTGHGVGMEVHELPVISQLHTTPLKEHSVITCEPGVYIEGLGGVRIEDDIVLKKDGNINLTGNLSRELIIL